MEHERSDAKPLDIKRTEPRNNCRFREGDRIVSDRYPHLGVGIVRKISHDRMFVIPVLRVDWQDQLHHSFDILDSDSVRAAGDGK